MKAVLFDLDGVIYKGNNVIPGALDTIKTIQKTGIPHMFVSNTTSRTPSQILEKLSGFGINTTLEHIWTPIKAVSLWMAHHKISGPIGLFVRKNVLSEFRNVTIATNPDPKIQAVVIGDMVEEWTIDHLNLALKMLIGSPQSYLVALGMTRYYMGTQGFQLDVGSIVKALEYATDRIPVVLGKPSQEFFQNALEKLQVSTEEAVMIGDDIVSDVAGAQKAGLKGVLVRTGKFKPSDLEGKVDPDAVLDSVADLITWIKKDY